MTLICRMSLVFTVTGVIGPELRALNYKKKIGYILPCLHSSIRKSKAILVKFCYNVCAYKVLGEFDNGLDRTSVSRVICP